MIAKIAVSAAVYAIDKPYDYLVPSKLNLQVGQRVIVPFGRANKRTEGIVLALEDGDREKLKPVDSVLDEEPLVDQQMLKLAAFLTERYFCTFYDAMKAILPAGVWFQEKATYTICDESWQTKIQRQPTALALMQTMQDFGGSAEESVLRKQFDEERLHKALNYLLKKKLIVCQTDHRRRVNDKTERIAVLTAASEDALHYAQSKKRSAPTQSAVLEMLLTMGECAAKELC